MALEKELTEENKLNNKKCLVCSAFIVFGSQIAENNIFKCKDCGERFHKKCMVRLNNCTFCQLYNLNPMQLVKNVLFVGRLTKGIKRHEIEFEVPNPMGNSELASTNNKSPEGCFIEVRSIRLKDHTDEVSNFINLFPDACTIMINNRHIKEFNPLHKQSSLKYRRDECIQLPNVEVGPNKLVITERIMRKDVKLTERIEPENHIVAIYVLESLQVPKPTNQLDSESEGNSTSGPSIDKFMENLNIRVCDFEESQSLLKESMLMEASSAMGQ
jgi:hypothetical protein